jgi:hypothetical protein
MRFVLSLVCLISITRKRPAAAGRLAGEPCRGSHDGSRAGMLLARCDVIDALVVCLAVGGDDILITGSGGLRALAGAAGIRVGLIGSGRLAARFAAARRNGHHRQRPGQLSHRPRTELRILSHTPAGCRPAAPSQPATPHKA